MTYRRGLQRVYAVLTAGWIVAVVIALPAERLKFWQSDQLTIVDSRPLDAPARRDLIDPTVEDLGRLAKKRYPGQFKDISDAQVGINIQKHYPGSYEDFRPLRPDEVGLLVDPEKFNSRPGLAKLKPSDIDPPSTLPADFSFVKADSFVPVAPNFAQSRTGKSLWLLGLLLGPPVAGYLVLFGIVPWVYRGFRPPTQN